MDISNSNSPRKGNPEPVITWFKVESWRWCHLDEKEWNILKRHCVSLGDHDKYFIYLSEDHEVFISSEMPFKRFHKWEHNESSYEIIEDATIPFLCIGQNQVVVIEKETLILKNILT